MVFSRGAVHSALWLVLTMLCLGCLYIAQDAEFLGFVQIIVYTGAIMMLFLFVLMLTGRDAGDSVFEVLRGQRVVATVVGIAFVVLLVTGLLRALGTVPTVGLDRRAGRARRDRVDRRDAVHRLPVPVRADQRAADHRGDRRDGADAPGAGARTNARTSGSGWPSGCARTGCRRCPGPGVFATSSSNATPALLPDGSIAPGRCPSWWSSPRASGWRGAPRGDTLAEIETADTRVDRRSGRRRHRRRPWRDPATGGSPTVDAVDDWRRSRSTPTARHQRRGG